MLRPMLRPLSLFRGTLDSCAGAMKYLRAGPIMGGKDWWHGRGERCEGGRGLRASEGWSEGRAGGVGWGGGDKKGRAIAWLVDVLTSVEGKGLV